MKYTNRQAHGNDFENRVHLAEHGRTKEEYEKLIPNGYTAELDLVSGVEVDFNGSVKTTCKNSVDCGSIKRMYENTKNKNLKIIIGENREIDTNTKSFDKIYVFEYNKLHFPLLWSNQKIDTLQDMVEYVVNVPFGRKGQKDNQKLWKQKREEIYKSEGKGLMTINVKIDGKKQRRIQCGFNIKELIKAGIPYKVYTKKYKNIDLPYVYTK